MPRQEITFRNSLRKHALLFALAICAACTPLMHDGGDAATSEHPSTDGAVDRSPSGSSDARGSGGATGGLATGGAGLGGTRTGGQPGTGGTASGGLTTGGSGATGGTLATGGGPATGGAMSTGGMAATGGAPATGGAKATGGAAATGGASGTGGAPGCTTSAKRCSSTGVPQHCDNTGQWVSDNACSSCQTCSNGTCQNMSAGAACAGGVCNASGVCSACSPGASCTSGIGECQTGAIDCSSGSPVCKAGNKPSGTQCGNGQTCSSGTLYPHQICNGSGQCYTPNGMTCSSGQCSGSTSCLDCTASTAPSSILIFGTTPICSKNSPSPGSVTLSVSGGSLGTGARWVWYTSSPPSTAGNGVGTGDTLSNVSPASTTTYYVRAEGTCGITATKSISVPVYTPPQITISPSSQKVDCTVAYVSWTNFYAKLSSTSAPPKDIQWYYTTADTATKTVCDLHYFRETTTLNLGVSPQITQTDWISVTDVCGSQAWASANLTVPDLGVCFP